MKKILSNQLFFTIMTSINNSTDSPFDIFSDNLNEDVNCCYKIIDFINKSFLYWFISFMSIIIAFMGVSIILLIVFLS